MSLRYSTFLPVALALFSMQVWAEGPPDEVGEAFEAAIMVEDGDEFVGTFRSQTTSIVQKPNGKARHEMEVVVEVDRQEEDLEERTLISFLKDGEDVSEKHRDDIENPKKKRDKKARREDEKPEEAEADFLPPWGDDAVRYDFDLPIQTGDIVEQGFRPRTSVKEDEGLGRGVLRWNADSLDPVSIDLELISPPRPLKNLALHMEFERQDDTVYATRMVTDGLAKILLMKREFHVDVRWSEIRPK